jgi:D-aspartate ligase
MVPPFPVKGNCVTHPNHTSTPVVVLRSMHHGGLAITRSLGRWGVPVYNVDADAHAPSFSSRYSKGKFVWDLEGATAEESVARLLDIGRHLGRPAILIPTTDSMAILAADHAEALRERFLIQDNSARLVRSLYWKKEMHFLARDAGVPTPDLFLPQSRQDVLDYLGGASFPVMLKANDDRGLRRRGLVTKVIVKSPAELLDWYGRLEDPGSPNLMFQEYIPGGADSIWMFNGYFDAQSECRFGVTGQKLRQCPVYTGPTSLGIVTPNPTVDRLTRHFMKAIGYQGILDIGYRYDARDGRYKVLDVNPRIGSTFRLFVGANGLDVARALYLDRTGQPVPDDTAQPGRKWMVEDRDLSASLRYFRDGKLSPWDWLRSYSGVQETSFAAADDPLPLLAMCRNDAAELLRRFKANFSRPSAPEPSAWLRNRRVKD